MKIISKLFQKKPFNSKKGWFKKAKKKYISEKVYSFSVSNGQYGMFESSIFVKRGRKSIDNYSRGGNLHQLFEKISMSNFYKNFLMTKRFCHINKKYHFGYIKMINL